MGSNHHPSPWNTERDALLTKLHGQPDEPSFSIMAAEMNKECGTVFTRNSLISRARRLDLAKRIIRVNSRFTKQVIPRKPKQPPKPRIRYSNASKRMITIFESREVLELQCAEVEPMNISLLDLGPSDCRWPYGELPAGIVFCGHTQHVPLNSNGDEIASSYCLPHFALSKRRMT